MKIATKTPMVRANISIITELKSFLHNVSESPLMREQYEIEPKAFIRKRILTLEKVAGLILNMPKRSLSTEIQDFFTQLTCGLIPTKAAFCMQRTKLNPIFFQALNRHLVELFYHYYGKDVRRWRGYKVQAIDGSTAYLVNKEKVVSYFGTQDNQFVSIPMARVMQIYDVLNDIIVWGDLYPIKKSEQNIAMDLVDSLHDDCITLYDRVYPCFALIFSMLNRQNAKLFVMRAKTGLNKEIKAFMNSPQEDIITFLTPGKRARKVYPEYGFTITSKSKVKVRLVKIRLPKGQTEVLITNLYDRTLFSMEDLAYLYSLRWEIEGCYGKQKNQLQLEQFSGHRVICIYQDYYATLFVANLQSLIENQSGAYLEAVAKRRKYRYKINRNVCWGALKNKIFVLLTENNPAQTLLYLQHLFEANLEPVRPARVVERKENTKRWHGKYQTFTNYKRAI